MPKIYVFPVPTDRTINKPCVLIERSEILYLYNLNNEGDVLLMNDDVRGWFKGVAFDLGWNHVEFHGDQCLLKAVLVLQERNPS